MIQKEKVKQTEGELQLENSHDGSENLKQELNGVFHEILMMNKTLMEEGKYQNLGKVCSQDITILAMIADTEKITAKEIQEKLKLPKTTVVSAVKRLAERGYVMQLPDEDDRRRFLLSLSKTGLEIHHEHMEYEERVMSFLVEKWSSEDQSILYEVLKRRRH